MAADLPIYLPLATDWATVAFGFAGVIVGGLITLLSAWQAQRVAARRERKAEAREMRATVLILLASLEDLRSFLQHLSKEAVWQAPGDADWVTIWQDRASVVAGAEQDVEFDQIAAAFRVARLVLWQCPQTSEEFTDGDPRIVANWIGNVNKGIVALETLSR